MKEFYKKLFQKDKSYFLDDLDRLKLHEIGDTKASGLCVIRLIDGFAYVVTDKQNRITQLLRIDCMSLEKQLDEDGK